VLDAVDTFYGEVLQHLKAWAAAAPKMREVSDLPAESRTALVSTALSSQDGAEMVAEGAAVESSSEESVDSSFVPRESAIS
jgi:hypothetical protein